MICRDILPGVMLLMVSACARQPALSARPPDQIPVAPRPQRERRLVAALGQGGGCHIKLQLHRDGPGSRCQAERDAAVSATGLAAQACRTRPARHNLAGWTVGQTHYELALGCPQP